MKFDVFHTSSDNKHSWRDNSHAKNILGWRPTGSADKYEIEDPGGWHQVLEEGQDLRRQPGKP